MADRCVLRLQRALKTKNTLGDILAVVDVKVISSCASGCGICTVRIMPLLVIFLRGLRGA